ncbi:hypothetical protein NDU88_006719 [Pleurodeles waltl]|uniref:Reverse transcriptase domain-containing protein n=1 Tax=Pleurodeles waltl TaxID=8319 RepID=A0AAV7N1U2_PLEWA|nr:hypothetical protein NDU88_006719 [Pleurodeles waltl]
MEDVHLPESQCGFREGRGTADMIFAARQLQQKCQGQNRDLYTTFVDLTKAFDPVSREGLWWITDKFGCPCKFVSMVRQFDDVMLARVLDNGDASDAYLVTNGVKQDWHPRCSALMFSAMLSHAFCDDEETSIKTRYRTDCSLFNLRRLQVKTKVEDDSVSNFLFAGDCTLNAATKAQMQQSMNCFSTACKNFGLTISTKKTEVLHLPALQKMYVEPTITAEGEILKAVDKFTYLCSTLSRSVNIDDEVDTRITKASSAFRWLWESVWERRSINLSTKLKMYKAVILPTLVYACETWTVYKRHAKKLNCFHMNCSRRLLKMTWRNKVPDTRLTKRLFYGELAEGKRTQGGQKKHLKDMLKVSLKIFGIDPDSWETLAQDSPPGEAASAKVLTPMSRAGLQRRRRSVSRQIYSQLFANQPSRPLVPDIRQSFPSLHWTDQPQLDTPYPVNLLNVMSLVIINNDR